MSGKLLLVAVLCGPLVLSWSCAQTTSTRKTLDHETEIQGYHCTKGYAWLFADGRLKRCTVARETAFGEATLPVGSLIALTPEGRPDLAQMTHDTLVRGYRCQGGSLLGPSEGATVAFYPSGKLKELFLANDQTVDGVPCAHGGLVSTTVHGNPSVRFNEDGQMVSCRLSQDFEGQKRGERYIRKTKQAQ